MTRSRYGLVAVTVIALVLGVLAATQFRNQDVYTRTLTAENASSLTTLIANISDRNSSLREEILDLRLRLDAAQGASQSSEAALQEAREQVRQLRVASGVSAVAGPGVEVRIDGPFDDKAMSDLVNEVRNAGGEAIAINGVRVSPRSWFGRTDAGIVLDGRTLAGPYLLQAVGAPETISVALTRTGGIIGQFGLIYARTRFLVTTAQSLQLPAGPASALDVAKPAK